MGRKHIKQQRIITLQADAIVRGDAHLAAVCETAIFGAASGRDNFPEGFALMSDAIKCSDKARAWLASTFE